MEEFCRLTGNREDTWYATNIEIVDYMKAGKQLKFTVDGDLVYNPSAVELWIAVDGQNLRIPAGACVKL